MIKKRELKGRSIIDFPAEYVCIDTETTGLNYEYDEIIEVAAIRVKDGMVIDKFSTLVKPKQSHCYITKDVLEPLGATTFEDLPMEVQEEYFSTHLIPQFIEDLTGIRNDDILTAPDGDSVFPLLQDFIGSSILVGHNINFDINFLYDALWSCSIPLKNDFIDTLRISRKLFQEMQHHRLSDMVEKLGVEQDNSHRALSDTIATFECFEKMKTIIQETQSFDEFRRKFKKNHSPGYNYNSDSSSVFPTVDEFDETNPVFGKIVVFTGALSCMTRKDAFQLVANLGGYPDKNITKKTNFLVIGNEEFAASVKDGKTKKMKKAESYLKSGCDISILTENTFFEMIQQ